MKNTIDVKLTKQQLIEYVYNQVKQTTIPNISDISEMIDNHITNNGLNSAAFNFIKAICPELDINIVRELEEAVNTKLGMDLDKLFPAPDKYTKSMVSNDLIFDKINDLKVKEHVMKEVFNDKSLYENCTKNGSIINMISYIDDINNSNSNSSKITKEQKYSIANDVIRYLRNRNIDGTNNLTDNQKSILNNLFFSSCEKVSSDDEHNKSEAYRIAKHLYPDMGENILLEIEKIILDNKIKQHETQ